MAGLTQNPWYRTDPRQILRPGVFWIEVTFHVKHRRDYLWGHERYREGR